MYHSNGKLTRLGITSRPLEDTPSSRAHQEIAQSGRDPEGREHRPVKRRQNTRVIEALLPVHQYHSVQTGINCHPQLQNIQKIWVFKTALQASVVVQPQSTT